MPDFSLKRLHVAVAEYPTEDGPLLRGIIFNPKNIFNGESSHDLVRYHEFFVQYDVYQIVVVETHMGPGELAKFLVKFGVYCGTWTGGVIAQIKIHEESLLEMMFDLRMNAEEYIPSIEGGVPA